MPANINTEKGIEKENSILLKMEEKNDTIVEQDDTMVKLVEFGKEDMTKLNGVDLFKILQEEDCHQSILTLTKLLHFNENLPENHNVYISNTTDSHAHIYDGNEWILVDENEVIDRIYVKIKKYIKEFINKHTNLLSQPFTTEPADSTDSSVSEDDARETTGIKKHSGLSPNRKSKLTKRAINK